MTAIRGHIFVSRIMISSLPASYGSPYGPHQGWDNHYFRQTWEHNRDIRKSLRSRPHISLSPSSPFSSPPYGVRTPALYLPCRNCARQSRLSLWSPRRSPSRPASTAVLSGRGETRHNFTQGIIEKIHSLILSIHHFTILSSFFTHALKALKTKDFGECVQVCAAFL